MTELAADRTRSQAELDAAPTDITLREAVLAAASAGQDVIRVQRRLEGIEAQCRLVEDELKAARETLLKDAADLQLPSEHAALASINDALDQFNASHQQQLSAAREWHATYPEQTRQREREREAREALVQAESANAQASIEWRKRRRDTKHCARPSARKWNISNSSLPPQENPCAPPVTRWNQNASP